MTSTFRLILAGLLSALALVAGLSRNDRDAGVELGSDIRAMPTVDDWSQAEVDALVTRIVDAGLFPNAEIDRSGANATGEMGIGDVEAAFVDPMLTAFVRAGEGWTLYIKLSDEEGYRQLRPGDVLTDDWQVGAISATSVMFEREGQTRTLDAYPSREG